MRGKGEAAKIKGPGRSRGARVPCFVLHCQACDSNLECPFWGADYRHRGLLSECKGFKIRARALCTALFTPGMRI